MNAGQTLSVERKDHVDIKKTCFDSIDKIAGYQKFRTSTMAARSNKIMRQKIANDFQPYRSNPRR